MGRVEKLGNRAWNVNGPSSRHHDVVLGASGLFGAGAGLAYLRGCFSAGAQSREAVLSPLPS